MNDDKLNLVIEKVVDAANAQHGRELSQPLRDALNGLADIDGHDAEQRLSRMTAALADVTSASGAGFIAVWLGAHVEHGAQPSPQVQPLLDCFLRFSGQVKTDDGDINEDEIDDELAFGLELLGQSLVSHLSRDSQSLQVVRANADIVAELERVESYSPGPMWVLELVRKVSGTLIVLHGKQGIGAKVEYRNISNCFHLFTLLQAALEGTMPGARQVPPDVLAVARGECMAECFDEAWWHYGQPVSTKPDLMTSVFGEQNPQEIGSIDGQQVMLLWPPIMESREWGSGFFGPALDTDPAKVELIEMLSDEDVTTWRQRIGLPNAQTAATKKPWWKFW